MNKMELLELLNSLKVDKEEYVILSSSALMLRGIMDTCGDLDIAVTQKGLDELKKNYDLKEKGNGWFIVNDKIECILDDMDNEKEKVGEYYLQDIYNYLGFIENSTREKDIKRVELIRKYIDELENKKILSKQIKENNELELDNCLERKLYLYISLFVTAIIDFFVVSFNEIVGFVLFIILVIIVVLIIKNNIKIKKLEKELDI